ncbi:exodeoxyribonuclease I [Thalassotalea mangrovi]|uniref:Exodeoxyribonuclease I n=1 Tax=Thalassotalea mangrovi TaxID=2572245 RepID=A0A4U1B499_9GAMM|nr:exodeoxyribonuclease I [Thalassotalea mangrovi]TKB44769.1 exodeoxyribonuclease I [Thalassotalea mangrovi]
MQGNQPTILWHDYETWGVSPKYDRPSQFAAIRTDMDLNILGEPEVFYCQPAADYLPHPGAALVTGITPQKAQREGLSEAEFAQRIQSLFTVANTTVAGYNSIRFDDEVSRYLFYRNFYDPYAREWQNGNSRWDIIDMVRLCYALRPDGINWPRNDEGNVSFRLELLTAANGISHEAAHDAMSDVYATIAMAKLIKDKHPKLYDFVFNLRNKREVQKLLEVFEMTPVVHTSSKISSQHGCTSWFAPVEYHPTNKNAVIAVDLSFDITPIIELDAEQLKQRLYSKRADLAPDELPVGIKLIHINKCPVVAPAKTLTESDAQRLDIDRQACLDNWRLLKKHAAMVREKLSMVFDQTYDVKVEDADVALYSGSFFNDSDKAQMQLIHEMPVEQLATYPFKFQDPRLSTLLFRFRARNYPYTLTADEQRQWQQYCQNKLANGENGLSYDEYMLAIENLAHEHEQNTQKMSILKALYQYVAS